MRKRWTTRRTTRRRFGFCVLPRVFTGDHFQQLRAAWRRRQRPAVEKRNASYYENTGLQRRLEGKATVLFSHLYIKMIILPRQARDKHRETQNRAFFAATYIDVPTEDLFAGLVEQLEVRKFRGFMPYVQEKRSFVKTGSGQTSGHLDLKTMAFRSGRRNARRRRAARPD